MTDILDPKHDSKRLLSDEEFAALIQAEYQASHVPSDDLERERAWKRLADQRQASMRNKKSWTRIIAPAAAALLILSFTPKIIENFQNTSRDKGAFAPEIVFTATHLENGSLVEKLGTTVVEGETLFFHVAASLPAHAALLYKAPDQEMQIGIADQSLDPREMNILLKDGEAFAYKVEAADRSLQVCVVVAVDSESLMAEIKKPVEPKHCLNFTKGP